MIGNEAGTGKDGAHHVQPLIQNGYAPEQRSGWVERGRGLVGWEGDFFMTEAMHMITFTGAPGAADQAAAPADHGAAGGFPSSLPLLVGFSVFLMRALGQKLLLCLG